MGQAVPSLASGMVGEMYVPQDYGVALKMKKVLINTKDLICLQNREAMTGPADPFASAFGGEQHYAWW